MPIDMMAHENLTSKNGIKLITDEKKSIINVNGIRMAAIMHPARVLSIVRS